MCVSGVRNVRFSENLARFSFLVAPILRFVFCLITDGVVTSLPFYYTSVSQGVLHEGKSRNTEHLTWIKFSGCGLSSYSFTKEELSLCIFSRNFLSNCSFEFLRVASFERLNWKTSLSKTRKASEPCFSNVADVCPVTLWKLYFIMDISWNTTGQLLVKGSSSLLNRFFTVLRGLHKGNFQSVFEKQCSCFEEP